MRDFIGAKNRPFVPEYRKKYFLNLIKNNCCVCIENIPIDTTIEHLVSLVKIVKLNTIGVFIPFNLITQKQLRKAYIFLSDKETASLLVSRCDDTTIHNKPIIF